MSTPYLENRIGEISQVVRVASWSTKHDVDTYHTSTISLFNPYVFLPVKPLP